ncbi:serine/threonine-protein kinase [Streptomyces bottropensis]|uniref:serine/threonine-protein kinase n=1 Tax=Streptomyces bottropensis TaxID=42235 RepID=UPI0036B2DAA4
MAQTTQATQEIRTFDGGRYLVRAPLGDGGMGKVWRAFDTRLNREVAIKEIYFRNGHGDDGELAEADRRMLTEAEAAAKSAHPSVVQVYDIFDEGARPCLVMQLVEGRTLEEVLRDGPLVPVRAARIGLRVLEALEAAHGVGVLHRDVKPSNIMVGPEDAVVVMDFGIARIEGGDELTRTGQPKGSRPYMSPERLLQRDPGSEADLWSLGVVLYEAVEGHRPFPEWAALGLDGPAEPVKAGALKPVIMGLLSPEPVDRPSTEVVRKELEAVAEGVALQGGASRGPRRRVALTVLIAVCVLVLLGASAYGSRSLWSSDPSDPSDSEPPANWARREVAYTDKAIPVSLRMPPAFTPERPSDARWPEVVYTDPNDVFQVKVRQSTGEKTAPVELAHTNLDWYEDGGIEPTGSGGQRRTVLRVQDRDVTSTTWQGRPAAVTDVTFLPAGEGDAARRVMNLFLVNGMGDCYRLQVSMPAAGEQRATGETIFRFARESLEIEAF